VQSALLDVVRSGETVLITDRGVPVARIEPVRAPDDPTGRLEGLVRAGFVRPGTGTLPVDFWAGPIAAMPKGVSVVEALIEERRSAW
jgi:antitoxin (DNA-binding transcriptional repressor) of toxin-antitoxin stability system